jgi:ATP-binding cassette subfamily B protein
VQGLIDGVAQTREAVKMHRYFSDVVHASPDLPISAVHSRCPPLRHGIEIRDVWFRYVDDGPWILRGLSLTLVRGCTTALVGLNGAGKTTLVKLLCRFYDPTHGSILWDGIDLRELPVDEVRQRLSVLFQDYMTWDLTARENIALSDVARIDDRTAIVETARSVGLDARLSQLPNGYDTVLGRTFASDQFLAGAAPGAELSGGQWQRLAIARALFRSTRDLTISDEPSAFLDPLAEQQVAQAALSRGPASTHLVVSHRLSTIRQADLVVVLEDGCIVESGTHAELVVQRGRYAHFFESQLVENNLTSPRNGARD